MSRLDTPTLQETTSLSRRLFGRDDRTGRDAARKILVGYRNGANRVRIHELINEGRRAVGLKEHSWLIK